MGANNWSRIRLGDHVEYFKGFAFKSQDYLELGHPVIRVSNFTDRSIDLLGCNFISPNEVANYEDYQIHFGDVIIATVGSWPTNPDSVVGKTIRVPKEADGALLNQNTLCLRATNQLDQRFLFYSLKDGDFQNYLIGGARGSANQASITIQSVFDYDFFCPSLSEQCAIAGILGALDDKIELNRRMNQTLESIARAVFSQWSVESEKVEGWETAVLNDLAESVLGGDWGKDTNEDGALSPAYCIRGADIPDLQEGGIGKMPLRYLKLSSLEKRKLQHGDIVVEISGGSPTQSTGRPVFISNTLLNRLELPLVASNFCRVFRPKDLIVSNFVYFWLRWLYSRDEFFQYENGTTGIKNFAFTIFCEQYCLKIPPKDVLRKFHQFTTPILEAMQNNAKESRTLASLRDRLLPKLMRGEVKVKDI